jgi:hypothetical protein
MIHRHRRIPEDFDIGARIIVGSVRNPWDWYVSLWSYGCAHPDQGLSQRLTRRRSIRGHRISRSPKSGIVSMANHLMTPVRAWRHVYSDPKNPALFKEWLRLLLDPKRRFDLGEHFGEYPYSKFVGFLTHRYIMLHSTDLTSLASVDTQGALVEFDCEQSSLDAVIRTENLNEDFIKAMQLAGYSLTEEQRMIVQNSHRTNASKRKTSLAEYYDQELLELVNQRDAFIVNKYGYKVPSLAAVV